MNVLLDTHICLWSILDDPRLSVQARRLVEKASTVFVSSASLWEVASKHSLGKLPVGAEEVRDLLLSSGAEFLPIMPEYCLALTGLPSLHNDPFDRMLIAQALVEPLHLLNLPSLKEGDSHGLRRKISASTPA